MTPELSPPLAASKSSENNSAIQITPSEPGLDFGKGEF